MPRQVVRSAPRAEVVVVVRAALLAGHDVVDFKVDDRAAPLAVDHFGAAVLVASLDPSLGVGPLPA
jgi:hypothetical protein